MTSNIASTNFTKIVCDTSKTGDAVRVTALLGCCEKSVNSVDDELNPSTNHAQLLLAEFVSLLSQSQPGASSNVASLQLLRPLLMIPSSYETPWIAIFEFVSALKELEPSTSAKPEVLTSMAEINFFFQQSVASWLDHSSSSAESSSTHHEAGSCGTATTRSARLWIMRLAQLIATSMLCGDGNDDSRQGGVTSKVYHANMLQLISTILSHSRNLESTLTDEMLDAIFKIQIRPDRIAAWLGFASQSRYYFRLKDWETLQLSLLASLRKQSTGIRLRDLPSLAKFVVSVARTGNVEVLGQDIISRWQNIIYHTMAAASRDAEIYSTIETLLRSNLASLPACFIRRWNTDLKSSDATKDVPEWILINTVVLFTESLRFSGSHITSRLITTALEKAMDCDESALACHEFLLKRLVTYDQLLGDFTNFHEANSNEFSMRQVQQAMNDITYSGRGQFSNGSAVVTSLSRGGILICQSLFLGRTQLSQQSHQVHAATRARWWMKSCKSILQQSTSSMQITEVCLVIVVMTTIFWEVPSSRRLVLGSLVQTLSIGNRLIKGHHQLSQLYCVIVSVIVKSLKKDHRRFDELAPVCDIFARPLDKTVFFELSSILSALSEARKAILLASEKYLDLKLADSFWTDSNRGGAASRLQCGLHGLCTIIAAQEWGLCEMQAWKLLFEAIVLNKPPLPVDIRTWLYQHLHDFMSSNRLSAASADHVLRATMIRYLHLSQESTKTGRSKWSLSRLYHGDSSVSNLGSTVENIVELTRLTISLLDYTTRTSKERKLFCSQELGNFLDVVAPNGRLYGGGAAKAACYYEFTHQSSDNFELSCSVAWGLMLHVVDYVLSFKLEAQRQSTRTIALLPDLTQATGALVDCEIQQLRSIRCVDQDQSFTLSWLERLTTYATSECQNLVGTSELDSMMLSLSEVIAELIFAFQWTLPNTRKLKQCRLRQILILMSSLLESKRQILNTAAETSDSRPVSTINPGTLSKTGAELFYASSSVLNDAINRSWPLPETEELIAPMIEYCHSLHSLTKKDRKHLDVLAPLPSAWRCIECMWTLYKVVGDEDASIRLIAYLEASCANDDDEVDMDETNASNISLRSIRTGADVDLAIQSIRLHVLQGMYSYFSLVLDEHSVTAHTLLNPVDSTKTSGFLNLRTIEVPAGAVIDQLKSLSRDLLSGLDGNSGGITEDMYLTYVELIESCAFLLRGHVESEEDCMVHTSLFSACIEAGEAVRSIVYTFPLKNTALFDKSFMLLSSVFPSICRRIRRRAIFLSDEISMSFPEKVLRAGDAIASNTFSDCVEVSLRWSRLKDPISTPWEHVVGTNRVEQGEHNKANAGDQLEFDGSAETVSNRIATSKDLTPEEEALCAKDATEYLPSEKLFLPSKDIWSSALSCSCLAFEEVWTEGSSVMLRLEKCSKCKIPFIFSQLRVSQKAITFLQKRRSELSRSIASVCLALQAHDFLKEHKIHQQETAVVEILATTWPSAPRARLCSLLETMSMVLYRALQLVCSHLRSGSHGDSNEATLLESLCYVSAWLVLDSDKYDFTLGTLNWYYSEKRKILVVQSTCDNGVADETIAKRLEKVLANVLPLQRCLQEIHQLLTKEDGINMSVLSTIDTSLCEALKDQNTSLLHCVTKKLNRLGDIATAGRLFEDFHDAKQAGEGGKKKRSRDEASGKLQKLRRRPIIRSRNQVVDMWLNLDHDTEGTGVGKDAYVDLEDFLVDG